MHGESSGPNCQLIYNLTNRNALLPFYLMKRLTKPNMLGTVSVVSSKHPKPSRIMALRKVPDRESALVINCMAFYCSAQ